MGSLGPGVPGSPLPRGTMAGGHQRWAGPHRAVDAQWRGAPGSGGTLQMAKRMPA